MDVELDRLHALMMRREYSYERKQERVKAYREYAAKISKALSFKWHPVGCSNPRNNHQGGSYGSHHIVLDEPFIMGRIHREAGDALCKPARQFNGNLWVDSDGPTCKRCLEIASRLAQQQPAA